jgi:hypothetical protein
MKKNDSILKLSGVLKRNKKLYALLSEAGFLWVYHVVCRDHNGTDMSNEIQL